MTDHRPRLFPDDASVRHIGEGLLACTLPRPEWTHEAHLAACLWLLTERPDVDVDAGIPGIIRRYNASVGGVNDDTQGYHETITRAHVAGVRVPAWLARRGRARRARQRVACLLRRAARLAVRLLQSRAVVLSAGAAGVRGSRPGVVAVMRAQSIAR